MALYHSILESIGNTPLISLPKITKGLDATLLFKCEFFNPLSSVKDRIALSMISEAEAKGNLKAGMHVIEPTSGNTGIGLAFVCAAKGYPVTLVMPETMSMERRTLLLMLGANIVLTPGANGMKGAIAKAQEILVKTPNGYMPRQFENGDNPLIHYRTTGPEIWNDTKGAVDVVIAGVGTGGTFTGVGKFLKEKKPSVKMIALEPTESPVISGGKPSPHKIQGIGAGFIPKNFDRSLMDGIETVSSEEALATAKRVIQTEGVPVGISGGAAIAAALQYAKTPEAKGKTIVVILASSTERYLSTLLGEDARTKAAALVTETVSEESLKQAQI
jgi:cysteine synthase A